MKKRWGGVGKCWGRYEKVWKRCRELCWVEVSRNVGVWGNVGRDVGKCVGVWGKEGEDKRRGLGCGWRNVGRCQDSVGDVKNRPLRSLMFL